MSKSKRFLFGSTEQLLAINKGSEKQVPAHGSLQNAQV